MNPILIALACGGRQQPMLDVNGNATCVQAQTGEVRRIEGRLSDCPTGALPLLTERGSACVQKDTGQPYYNTRRQCPNGAARGLDSWGNPLCRVP
jgi:hypothetical protein